ncbi:MAG: hypothetical protein JWO05_136 [Gemmatimonadetes bacterium]|nr:hypothetical protein [Gemmatimonadota bacterium]
MRGGGPAMAALALLAATSCNHPDTTSTSPGALPVLRGVDGSWAVSITELDGDGMRCTVKGSKWDISVNGTAVGGTASADAFRATCVPLGADPIPQGTLLPYFTIGPLEGTLVETHLNMRIVSEEGVWRFDGNVSGATQIAGTATETETINGRTRVLSGYFSAIRN